MKELLDRLSSYNLFNYLLPGVVFAIVAKSVTSYNFLQDDIFVGAFTYYFIGLVVSRVGSTILEPSYCNRENIRAASGTIPCYGILVIVDSNGGAICSVRFFVQKTNSVHHKKNWGR